MILGVEEVVPIVTEERHAKSAAQVIMLAVSYQNYQNVNLQHTPVPPVMMMLSALVLLLLLIVEEQENV